MALKQELLVSSTSDLHGPAYVLAEYDDVSLKISQLIVKSKDSNMKVTVVIDSELSKITKEVVSIDKDHDVSVLNLHFVKTKEDGLGFEKGFKVKFSREGAKK